MTALVEATAGIIRFTTPDIKHKTTSELFASQHLISNRQWSVNYSLHNTWYQTENDQWIIRFTTPDIKQTMISELFAS